MKPNDLIDLMTDTIQAYNVRQELKRQGTNYWEIPREYSKASIQRKILVLREELLALSKQLDEG